MKLRILDPRIRGMRAPIRRAWQIAFFISRRAFLGAAGAPAGAGLGTSRRRPDRNRRQRPPFPAERDARQAHRDAANGRRGAGSRPRCRIRRHGGLAVRQPARDGRSAVRDRYAADRLALAATRSARSTPSAARSRSRPACEWPALVAGARRAPARAVAAVGDRPEADGRRSADDWRRLRRRTRTAAG